MQKSPDAFRTISEVAAWLDTPAHVLRFWESRFPEVAPVKRAGGRRYYRPADMRLLGGIKHLLHTEGHTIKSVQDRLKTEGAEAIGALAVAALPGESAPCGEAADADMDETVDAYARTADGQRSDVADYYSEIPPIGFFFDDADDADPAEAQSGTFAQVREAPDPEDAAAGSEPTAPTDVARPAPSPDPDDDDPAMAGAPVSVAAALRGLEASLVPPSQRDVLPGLVARLSRLAAPDQ